VPFYVAQLVLLKVNPTSPAYVILTFVNNYVATICAVFATGAHLSSPIEPQLTPACSLEHGHLALACRYARPRKGQLAALPGLCPTEQRPDEQRPDRLERRAD
jgi:hypothetical protein